MTLRRVLSRYAIFVALAAECLVVGLTTETFFTAGNLSNVLRQNAFIAILAMLTGTVIAGPFLVAAFALGLYGWPAVVIALGVAAFGAAVLAQRIEHEIKRQDPAWDELHDRARPLVPVRPRADDPSKRFDPRHHWRR